jgi:hypothetical protein
MDRLSLFPLFEHQGKSTIASWLVVSMVPTYLLWLVGAVMGRRLKTTAAPLGIVSLELAGSASRAQAIIDSWDDAARSSARHGLWLDYAFLVCYAVTLVLGCNWASRQLAAASVLLEWVGGILASAVILAAAFDAIENLALLAQLRSRPRPVWSALAVVCASAKFLLLVLGINYFLGGTLAWVVFRPVERTQIVLVVGGAAVLIRAYLASLPAVFYFAFRHALLAVVVVLLFAMIYGQFGTEYGIERLFWHDRPTTRIAASLGATLLLADLGIIVFLAAPELVVALVGAPPENAGRRTVTGNTDYLSRFLMNAGLPLVVLLLAPALFPAAFPYVPRSSGTLAGGFLGYCVDALIWTTGVALGAAIPLLILRLLRLLIEKRWPAGSELPENPGRSIGVFYGVFIGVYILLAGPLYPLTSPAFAICALLAILVMTYAALQYFTRTVMTFLRSWPVPPGAAAAGVLLAFFGLMNNDSYKLRFPNMSDYYPGGGRGLVDLRQLVSEQYTADKKPLPAGGAVLVSDGAALQNWLAIAKSTAPAPGNPAKPKLAIVAMSGGAARAAFWSAVVLDRLEAEIPDFGKHVRIMTGASGGMVGAAYYIKHRKDLLAAALALATPSAASTVTAAGSPLAPLIPLDSITPVAAHIALRDVWQAFLPRIGEIDRGIVLERDWAGIDIPIQSLRDFEQKGEIPSIILSPMIIEDGRRLLISNLDLWKLTRTTGDEVTAQATGSRRQLYSLSALEFFRLFPYAVEFHLATGVRMSASFPYVSPAVSLPTNPPRRVVDAGYYDNYGIQLAAAWVQTNVDWLIRETSGVVLVQVRDAISLEERLDVADSPTGFWASVGRSFQFLTSPLEGAEQARSASGLFRNDQDVQDLSDLFTARIKSQVHEKITNPAARQRALERAGSFFTTVIFENSAEVDYGSPSSDDPSAKGWRAARHSSEVSLDWYLSRAEQDALRAAILSPDANTTRNERLDHIRGLAEKVAKSHGFMRSYWESQLHTALNYEYLVQLRQWWAQPAPMP